MINESMNEWASIAYHGIDTVFNVYLNLTRIFI
jgi:hypothetical protein